MTLASLLAGGPRAVLRQLLFQAHWLIGISLGTLLMVIGLSGAILSFEDEWLGAFNPGVLSLPVQTGPVLAPPALLAALAPLPQGQSIATVVFSTEPGRSVQLLLQARPGNPKLPPLYVDPYTGRLLGSAAGQGFFDWIERVHRFLLLPREPGRVAAGVLASGLLLLALSGLYLRWPQQPFRLRSWLSFNPRLKGRSFLWALHAVLATWALPAWLLLASTGIYWSFDTVRSTVDGWAGVERASRLKREKPPEALPVPDLSLAWLRFDGEVPAWRSLRLRLPAHADDALELQWLAPDAAHERQRNQMHITLDGTLQKDQRFADLSAGKRALAAIYPLHMGRYFGLPVRFLMALSALALPVLGVSGWMLYLQRRRQKRTTRINRRALLPGTAIGSDSILVAWASQSGRAESLALRTAAALQAAGRKVVLKSLASMAPVELAGYSHVLFVVSTFGDGQAPDRARGFADALEQAELTLVGLSFAVLALGNRQYAHFCGFGEALQARLQTLGARLLQTMTSVCETEPGGLEPWFDGLIRFGVDAVATAAARAQKPDADWQRWTLAQRHLLNPGSVGEPLFELALRPATGAALPGWAPGGLVEIQPRHPDVMVEDWIRRHGFDPAMSVTHAGATLPLAALLAASQLPLEVLPNGDLSALLKTLQTLAARRYSIASIVEDGSLQLIVRQHHHAGGLGLASGFLTVNCVPGDELMLRLLANPSFTAVADDRPCLFIGNGSGIAGLRGLLRERVRGGLGRNWLIFGERYRASDSLCTEEFDTWRQAGLVDIDRVFSREPGGGYVQDHLRARRERLGRWLDDGAVIHVCGSLNGMAGGVEKVLEEMLGRDGLAALAAQGRYLRDVY